MTRKKRPDKSEKKEPKPFSMFPDLHGQVSAYLEEDNVTLKFHNQDDPDTTLLHYDTRISGTFLCKNLDCKLKLWKTRMMAMTIRLYPSDRYNARIYNQRCKLCDEIGSPIPDEASYIERITYRLKKWYDVEQNQPCDDDNFPLHTLSPGNNEHSEYHEFVPPQLSHRYESCEACRAGHCLRNNRASFFQP